MTVDETRIRLEELRIEYFTNHRLHKQLKKDIETLDELMARNFDAYWNMAEQCYEQ